MNQKISLFIPTYNAIISNKDGFVKTLDIIAQANLHRVLIIDSSSHDETTKEVKLRNFECIVILEAEFNHGGTRQMAVEILGDSDIIIFLTQDSILENIDSLSILVEQLIQNDNIAAVYGRQIPHKDADLFACHLRYFNYSNKSYVRSYSDKYVWGMKTIFASNSFAAYKVAILNKIHGFPKHVILGEDTFVFARLLQNKYQVYYEANALCSHSHNYRIIQEFKRYFDIGVFHRSESWIMQEFGYPTKQGLKFMLSELKFLKYKPWYWPKSITRLLIKYIGYKLGYNYDLIGVRLCRKLSMNKNFWWQY